MKKHAACIGTQHGWVDIDDINNKAINCVKEKLHDDIFNSKFYKDKEGIFWPKIQRVNNYKSTHGNALSYYETEYIHHILRYPLFTPNQFKESLLFLCDVCNYCKDNGYFLRTHLWNVTYVRGKPFIIDIRDFEKLGNQSWKSIFMGHFRNILSNHCPIHAEHFVNNYKYILDKLSNCGNNLQRIKIIINMIEERNISNEQWSNYHGSRTKFLYESNVFTEKLYQQIKTFGGGSEDKTKSYNLFNMIENIECKTIIELGCNNGLYTFGCSKFAPTIGIDYDIKSIHEANEINKKLNTNTQFAHVDILNESKNNFKYGQDGAYGNTYEVFKSELLIAPAVIHHLYNSCKSLEKIIRIFNNFATKYMIIELIPITVNKEQLINEIEKYNWKLFKSLPSSPSPREWLMFNKVIF